jgi:eukaryotic-like serine/threonine-protein kinase
LRKTAEQNVLHTVTETSKATKNHIIRECALCGFTTRAVLVVCPDDGSALVTHKPDPFIGTTLSGRFDIIELIGSGGMGNVYKAHQRIVERDVAVKILHSEKLQKREAVLRFQQEARAVATLSHRNIVGFFDFGLTEDNVPYIVMDYVDGRSLLEAIRTSTLPLDCFISIFTQLCDALDHAHDKGVIHRDIKPSNIMLSRTVDGGELVKILDFGIAKLLPRNDAQSRAALTQTGELFGSPQYMSPEQFAGQPLDARSDMYSVGCVMYEALTGQPPVTGNSIIELVQKHTNERPAPLRAVKPDLAVPQQLEGVIFKSLEKDPEQRFPSMAALKHNLQFVARFAEEERSSPAVATHRQPRRLPILQRSVKIALALTLFAFSFSGAFCLIVLSQVNPAGDTSLIDAADSIRLTFTRLLDPRNEHRRLALTDRLRDSYAAKSLSAEALRLADQAVELSVNSHEEGWAAVNQLFRRAQIQEQFRNPNAANSWQEALSALRALSETNRANNSWTSNLQADQPIDATIVSLERKLNGRESAALASDLVNTVVDIQHAGLTTDALPYFQELASLKNKLTATQKSEVVTAMKDFADHQAALGKDDAESLYKSAAELQSINGGPQSEGVAEINRDLGLYYSKHGQIIKAEATLMDALAMAQAAGGEHSPLVVKLYDDLGEVYRSEKEFDKATEMFKLSERLKQISQ